jgi:hypothetical protein
MPVLSYSAVITPGSRDREGALPVSALVPSRELASFFRESPQKGLQPFAMVLGAETVSGAVVVSLSGLRSALPLVSLSVFPTALLSALLSALPSVWAWALPLVLE